MSKDRAFYVGYLPMPRRHMVFLWIAAPLVAGALGALAGVMSASQRDPGDGVWDTGSVVLVEGTMLVEPYPLVIDDGGATHLLVEITKTGADERAAPFAGSRVTVSGYSLERDGRRMLELVDGDDAIVRGEGASRAVAVEAGAETVTLRGEILDSKCYLGAMKPGDGKGHKACATLCVTGGIPPLLLSWDPDGTVRHLLLVDADGGSAREVVQALMGEPVAVTGRLGRIGDIETLAIDATSIERYSP